MTDLHPGLIVVIAAILYACGFLTGSVLARRRTHDRLMRHLRADPENLRALATEVEDARFRAASAHAERRVGGLLPPEGD
jgi:hypothetical protein